MKTESFRIFLDDAELGELSSSVQLKEESTLTFIRADNAVRKTLVTAI